MASKLTKELARIERPHYLSPFSDMERLFEEVWERPFSLMRKMWPEVGGVGLETLMPVLDVYESDHEVIVKADLPGIKKDDVEITLRDNVLTISGERKSEEKAETGKYRVCERRLGSFSRSIELPFEVDAGKIIAHFENGVLEVKLTKSETEEKKVRKIPITS